MTVSAESIFLKDFFIREPLAFKKHAQLISSEDLLRLLKLVKSADEIKHLIRLIEPEKFVELIKRDEVDIMRQLEKKLEPEQLASYVGMLDNADRESAYQTMSAVYADAIKDILTYPKNSAGSLMIRNILSMNSLATVRETVKKLKSKNYEHIQHVFVINEQQAYVGTIPVSSLVTSNQNTILVDIMNTEIPGISAMSNKEDLEVIIKDYYLPVLPVVGQYQELLGMIRTENILKTLQEESISAIQAMVGVSREEKVLSPASLAIKKRLPWLNINLLTAFLAAAVVGLFEKTIAQYTALAVLLPVIAGQAGNTGAQALAVMMRGLALREIHVNQSYKAVKKEMIAGFINGLIIGGLTAIGVYFWSKSLPLALLISASMIMALIIAGISGVIVPAVLKILKQDPAQSSSIILTTITDCASFGIFLTLASIFIKYL